jgi:hypothetical protein
VASGQTATFIYVPSVEPAVAPGSSFTFEIEIAFTPGGSVSNLEGLSYWFQQKTPAGAPFNFAITLRDASVGPFTDLQTASISYPQNLSPVNANDLGGLQPTGTPGLGAGTYAVANITVSVSNTASPGQYIIDNTTSGGKISVITDSNGHTFAIPEADFTIDVIPEPATWITPALGVIALLLVQRRRILKLCSVS